MAKHTTTSTGSTYVAKKINWDELELNPDNARDLSIDPNALNLGAMVPQLLSAGRVIDPLSVEPSKKNPGMYTVLRGNRRVGGVHEIMKGAYTPEQKAGFQKIDCQVYENLTAVEREDLIYDHGSTEPLSREDTVKACWRLFRQGHEVSEIGDRMYGQLARYTGNEKKLGAYAKLSPAERRTKINSWFAGTLRQDILYGIQLGPYIREQYLLTRRFEDGKIRKEDVLEVKCDKDAMKRLWTARTADLEENGGNGWSPDTGGENFNIVVQKLKDEHAGRADPKEKVKQPSATKLTALATTFNSPAIRAALTFGATGDVGVADEVSRLDGMFVRQNMVSEILTRHAPEIADEHVKALVNAILGDGAAAEVETALAPFLRHKREPKSKSHKSKEETVAAE